MAEPDDERITGRIDPMQVAHHLLHRSPIATWVADASGTMVGVNDAALNLFGVPSREMVLGRYNILTDPTHQKRGNTGLVRLFEEALGFTYIDNFDTRKLGGMDLSETGTVRRVRVTAEPILADGEVLGAIFFNEDVTGQVRAEHRLRSVEQRFRSFINQTADAIFCYEAASPIDTTLPVDQQFEATLAATLVECNQAFADLRGVEGPDVLRGQTVMQVSRVPIEDFRLAFARFVQSNYDMGPFELPLETDGVTRYFEFRVRGSIEDGGLTRFWGRSTDITDRRLAEKALEDSRAVERRARSREATARIAGSIMHDFNNLLLVIEGNADLALAASKDEPDERREMIQDIKEVSVRARGLTRRLLNFNRPSTLQATPCVLDEHVDLNARVIRPLLHATIDLKLELGAPGAQVLADSEVLSQILVNLCINARDAMEMRPGTLTVATQIVAQDHRDLVELAVTDTGDGMDKTTRDHIFEPWFTTKARGSGTGLGLSVVRDLVREMRGFIEVESRLGVGSTFRIRLPLAEDEVSISVDHVPVLTPAIAGATGCILLVDDDRAVRRTCRRILEQAGWRVITAPDGTTAVQRYEQSAGHIDLVMMDVVLPNLVGPQAFDAIYKIHPVPVLFTSGYSQEVLPPDMREAVRGRLLQKPFDRDALIQAVQGAVELSAEADC